MLASQGHRAMIAVLRRHGGGRHHELIHTLGASDATIRRDPTILDERGIPRHVPGALSLIRAFGSVPDGMAETVHATGALLHHNAIDPLADARSSCRSARTRSSSTAAGSHRSRLPPW
jgi:DeoR/GlpR family transcriptional regulator of sugar metabolism